MTFHLHDETYRYCSRCGNQLKPKIIKRGEPSRPTCNQCGYVVYLDPKVVVGTIISNKQQEIALVRRAIEPGYGMWVFPGGYVDRGEKLQEAAIREAREEANLQIRIETLINLYSYDGNDAIVIVYAATVVRGYLSPKDESLDAAWFRISNIPWSKLAFPSTREALRDYVNSP